MRERTRPKRQGRHGKNALASALKLLKRNRIAAVSKYSENCKDSCPRELNRAKPHPRHPENGRDGEDSQTIGLFFTLWATTMLLVLLIRSISRCRRRFSRRLRSRSSLISCSSVSSQTSLSSRQPFTNAPGVGNEDLISKENSFCVSVATRSPTVSSRPAATSCLSTAWRASL